MTRDNLDKLFDNIIEIFNEFKNYTDNKSKENLDKNIKINSNNCVNIMESKFNFKILSISTIISLFTKNNKSLGDCYA